MPEHIQALGAVMHAVCCNVRENRPAREGKFLSIAHALDDFIRRMFFPDRRQFRLGFDVQIQQLRRRVWDAAGIQSRPRRLDGQGVGPGVDGSDHVRDGGLERAGADVEPAGELLGGQFLAGGEDLARGPVVVEKKNVQWVAGGHGDFPLGRLCR